MEGRIAAWGLLSQACKWNMIFGGVWVKQQFPREKKVHQQDKFIIIFGKA